MAPILGIDAGQRRIGVAVSDADGVLALPLTVLDAAPKAPLAEGLRRLCRERAIERVVVGLPLRMDGSEGPAAVSAREFAAWVGRETGLPVELWDERLTTVIAARAMIEGGERRSARRKAIDKLAAQVMLQHYLDCRSGAGRAPPPDPI